MARTLDALADHIESHLDAFAATARRTRWEPIGPDAPYKSDQRLAERQFGPGVRDSWGQDELRYGLHAAVLATNVSAQLLEAVKLCLTAREVMFPLAPIVRSIEEHCGYVHWLLFVGEPGWSVRDRVAQATLARIHDLTRAKSTAKILQHPDLPKMGGWLREARKVEMPALFYRSERHLTSAGELVLRGRTFPRLSELGSWTERTHGGGSNSEGIYAVLSNATHPTFSHIREFVHVTPDGATQWRLENSTYVYRMTRAALVSFDMAWQLLVAYLGHPQEEVLELQARFDRDPGLSETS